MNGTKVLGLAAMGAFLVMAAPVEHARAVSLINPGAAGTLQEDSRQLTTEVHWHHHHWHHWHRWRNHDERVRYQGTYREHYYDYDHDRDHDHGWRDRDRYWDHRD